MSVRYHFAIAHRFCITPKIETPCSQKDWFKRTLEIIHLCWSCTSVVYILYHIKSCNNTPFYLAKYVCSVHVNNGISRPMLILCGYYEWRLILSDASTICLWSFLNCTGTLRYFQLLICLYRKKNFQCDVRTNHWTMSREQLELQMSGHFVCAKLLNSLLAGKMLHDIRYGVAEKTKLNLLFQFFRTHTATFFRFSKNHWKWEWSTLFL